MLHAKKIENHLGFEREYFGCWLREWKTISDPGGGVGTGSEVPYAREAAVRLLNAAELARARISAAICPSQTSPHTDVGNRAQILNTPLA
mmetsp:Transcript_89862/g.268090  ORF Transcript_89862/g.268090 Transcript_89862/m.268090 type:complete len:90 (+) Transcript_89862:301-570(+)